jgi:shikimate 5-dehydrogenase
MLVHQAAEQLRLFTGREAPLATLSEAFDAAADAR